MKTLKQITGFALILAIIGFSGCTKTTPNLTKSSTIVLKAVTNSSGLKSTEDIGISTANISIANLQIEENSGNDGENVDGGNNTENNEADVNEGSETETDNSDILLAGPFSLDITNGSASVGQVDVYPGTFKKVDFDFQISSTLNNNSIVISGNYSALDGTIVPFTINSSFAQKLQLPLVNYVTVTENSSVNINIVFDVNTWISGIDFSSATASNGEILIDNANNIALLSVFESNLATYVEQED